MRACRFGVQNVQHAAHLACLCAVAVVAAALERRGYGCQCLCGLALLGDEGFLVSVYDLHQHAHTIVALAVDISQFE